MNELLKQINAEIIAELDAKFIAMCNAIITEVLVNAQKNG
jgi:hypothetical protein